MFFDFIRGGQILSHNIEMFREVIKKLFTLSLLIALIFICVNFKKEFTLTQIRNTYIFIIAERYVETDQGDKILNIIVENEKIKNKSLSLPAKNIIKNKTLLNNKNRTISLFKKISYLSIITYIFNFCFLTLIFLIKGYFLNKNKYLRGAKIVPLKHLNKIIKKYNKQQLKIFQKNNTNTIKKTEQLLKIENKHKKLFEHIKQFLGLKKYYNYKIANAIYPYGAETIHTIITGASGTGKTMLITDLIEQIRKNGDRAIIYDRMGTFVSKFYNGELISNNIKKVLNDNNLSDVRRQELIDYYNLKKDIILNPKDIRSPYWSIFNEVRDSLDFDNIASALIPETNNIDPFWNVAARILFSSVANKLKENNQTSNKELTDKLLKINLKEAATLVKGTPAQTIIDEKNSKTALSVMSMMATNLRSLIHLRDKKVELNEKGEIIKEEEPFSIRKWIQNDDQEGFLFISSRADRHETLKPLITTWLDIAINSLLSLEQSSNRKIWIIIDELPSLYYLPSLHTGLAESRQFGGCFVLSMQVMAQLRAIYGKEKAEATSGLCRNRVILNTPDEDTATWCSNSLGKTEIQEVKENISFGANQLRDGVNINKQEIQKNIILPTEIMQLQNLTAYVKFAGDFPIAKSSFKYKNYAKVAERYEENIISAKSSDNLNNLKESHYEEENKEEKKDNIDKENIKTENANQDIDLFD